MGRFGKYSGEKKGWKKFKKVVRCVVLTTIATIFAILFLLPTVLTITNSGADKTPPANAGDSSSIPGPKRFHILGSH